MNLKFMYFSFIVILLAYIQLIYRMIFPNVGIMYNIVDGTWMMGSVLFVESLVYKRTFKYHLLILIPLIIGIIDELLQYFTFFPEQFEYFKTYWSRTFDIKDIMAYLIGFIIACLIIISTKLFYKVKSNYSK